MNETEMRNRMESIVVPELILAEGITDRAEFLKEEMSSVDPSEQPAYQAVFANQVFATINDIIDQHPNSVAWTYEDQFEEVFALQIFNTINRIIDLHPAPATVRAKLRDDLTVARTLEQLDQTDWNLPE